MRRTFIKALMYLKFSLIPLLTTELAALESIITDVSTFIFAAIVPILSKLASYTDMHKILYEFEFWPDSTTYCGCRCPRVSEKYPIDL